MKLLHHDIDIVACGVAVAVNDGFTGIVGCTLNHLDSRCLEEFCRFEFDIVAAGSQWVGVVFDFDGNSNEPNTSCAFAVKRSETL